MKHLFLVLPITFFLFIPFLNKIDNKFDESDKLTVSLILDADSAKNNEFRKKTESFEDFAKKEKLKEQNIQLNKISDTLNNLNDKFDIILKKLNENKKPK